VQSDYEPYGTQPQLQRRPQPQPPPGQDATFYINFTQTRIAEFELKAAQLETQAADLHAKALAQLENAASLRAELAQRQLDILIEQDGTIVA